MRCCPPRANASRCESSPRPSPFGTLSHHPFRTLPYSCQIADSRALSNHAHTSPQDGLAVGSQARSLRSMTVSALIIFSGHYRAAHTAVGQRAGCT